MKDRAGERESRYLRGEGGDDVFVDWGATGYDHGYDAEMLYLGLALEPKHVEGFVEGAWSGLARMSQTHGPSQRRGQYGRGQGG
jgi:hypothetical protein